jgi:hypothetical protein
VGLPKKVVLDSGREVTIAQGSGNQDQTPSEFPQEFQYGKEEIIDRKSSEKNSKRTVRKEEMELEMTRSVKLNLDIDSLSSLKNQIGAAPKEKERPKQKLGLTTHTVQKRIPQRPQTNSIEKEIDNEDLAEKNKSLSKKFKLGLALCLSGFFLNYFFKLEKFIDQGASESLLYAFVISIALLILGIFLYSYVEENLPPQQMGRAVILLSLAPLISYLGMSTYLSECKKFVPFDRWLYKFEIGYKHFNRPENFKSAKTIRKMHDYFLSIYDELPANLQQGQIGHRTNLYRLMIASDLPSSKQEDLLKELKNVFNYYPFKEDIEYVRATSSLAQVQYRLKLYDDSLQDAQRCIASAMKLDVYKTEPKVFDCQVVTAGNALQNKELEEAKGYVDLLWDWKYPNDKKKYLSIVMLLDQMNELGLKDYVLEKYHGILDLYRETPEKTLLIHLYKKLEDIYKEKQDFGRQEVYHGHRKVLEEGPTILKGQ